MLASKNRYGSGRYEIRMKNLPGPYGCSCFWSYYDGRSRPKTGQGRYTEIDIEMPAHIQPQPPAWINWRRIVGLNTWSDTDADADATYLNNSAPGDPFDGRFHVYRYDWRVSGAVRSIVWYMDGIEVGRTQSHVSDTPAELWLGAWPAPWPGMRYDFNVKHMYVDWVRVSAL